MSEPASVRPLPDRPNLDHLRNQAKTLLDDVHAGSADAIVLFITHAPRTTPQNAKLADAQFVLARSYGMPSWPKLVEHVERLASQTTEEALLHRFGAAIHSGWADALRTLLQTHSSLRAKVNAPIFPFGGRPVSAVRGDASVLGVLIDHGADVNLKSDWWAGPWGVLETASPEAAEVYLARGATIDVFAAAHLNRLDLLESMLKHDPSLVHAKGGDGCRPLHFARTEAAMDLILSFGADIDARDVDHTSTAAQWALNRPPESMDRCNWLIARGASVDIFMAAASGKVELVDRALHQDASAIDARVNAPGYTPCPVGPGSHIYSFKLVDGQTPHEVAAEFGHRACLDRLLERSTPKLRLRVACTTGDEATAKALLRSMPALPDSFDADDHRILPHACWNRAPATTVKLLLDVGFDPYAPGPSNGTALHCAAWMGRPELVETILSHPRVKSRIDELLARRDTTHHATPLDWCCHGSTNCWHKDGDYEQVARQLMSAGAIPGKNLIDATPAVREAIESFTI
jgi:hypothetical protein